MVNIIPNLTPLLYCKGVKLGMEAAFETVKKTYKTNTVKVPQLIELMYKQEKGSQLRKDYALAAVSVTLSLFKENRLGPMTKEECSLLANHIMNEI